MRARTGGLVMDFMQPQAAHHGCHTVLQMLWYEHMPLTRNQRPNIASATRPLLPGLKSLGRMRMRHLTANEQQPRDELPALRKAAMRKTVKTIPCAVSPPAVASGHPRSREWATQPQ